MINNIDRSETIQLLFYIFQSLFEKCDFIFWIKTHVVFKYTTFQRLRIISVLLPWSVTSLILSTPPGPGTVDVSTILNTLNFPERPFLSCFHAFVNGFLWVLSSTFSPFKPVLTQCCLADSTYVRVNSEPREESKQTKYTKYYWLFSVPICPVVYCYISLIL